MQVECRDLAGWQVAGWRQDRAQGAQGRPPWALEGGHGERPRRRSPPHSRPLWQVRMCDAGSNLLHPAAGMSCMITCTTAGMSSPRARELLHTSSRAATASRKHCEG